ncbi:pentapeptide repeat-containing protein [Micromonospora carbonacea subsp. aurantiaca]|uniref:Pentapeptide repeat-containing protein n=1 Tax=Micromonospora carbonacea TaxID=47853 RepID=A0A7H8XM14_9ACTN|nr:pentapeptide repeat-containing protein [Micromonospora carbonacea]
MAGRRGRGGGRPTLTPRPACPAPLRHATLRHATLRRATLRRATLRRATLRRAAPRLDRLRGKETTRRPHSPFPADDQGALRAGRRG